MVDTVALVGDLRAEQDELRALLVSLREDDWNRQTPAPGWTIRHQVAHLAYFDSAAVLALTDPAGFARLKAQVDADPAGFGELVLAPFLSLDGEDLLELWVQGSAALESELLSAPPDVRVPWFGPPMSVPSKVTARLMETWAHGQDVIDVFGHDRGPTPRLRHIADLACRARPYAYAANRRPLPQRPVFVDLVGPEGGWTWGDRDAVDRISGPILDFCLAMTRRRHVDDTALVGRGEAANEWLRLGQAYAGEPGPGRRPGQFKTSSDPLARGLA